MQENNNSSFQFSGEEIRKVLASPEGKKLLQLLNKDGGAALRQAADAVKSGNYQRAQEALSPIMETKEASALVQKLNKK